MAAEAASLRESAIEQFYINKTQEMEVNVLLLQWDFFKLMLANIGVICWGSFSYVPFRIQYHFYSIR